MLPRAEKVDQLKEEGAMRATRRAALQVQANQAIKLLRLKQEGEVQLARRAELQAQSKVLRLQQQGEVQAATRAELQAQAAEAIKVLRLKQPTPPAVEAEAPTSAAAAPPAPPAPPAVRSWYDAGVRLVRSPVEVAPAEEGTSASHSPSLTISPDEPFDAAGCGAATGLDVPKTDGIPNYMLRTCGTVCRLAEGLSSAAVVGDDGVVYEVERQLTLLSSDVIDMVKQQGGLAEKVDHLGENILVDGLLFDDFKAKATFEISAADLDGCSGEGVTLEIVEPRPPSDLELGQLGDDEGKKASIASILSLAPGFSGWTARVIVPGRVRAGFKIANRDS